MTTAEIITIGTELLLGETIDTNTRHIAQTLRGLGIDLFRTQTIGDNAGRIAAIMREALDRVDFIITTGGLGPTVDDPTREAAALASGGTLEYHPELWTQIVDRLSRYGRTPTKNQKRQAYLPQNAIAIENPVGTAPAFIVEIKGKSIICLPGVPREMESLIKIAVIPYLREHFHVNEVIGIRTLHVSGVGEGVLDERIGDLETLANPTVGLMAHSGIVDIRIVAKARIAPETDQMIAKIESVLLERLGEDIFGADADTLEAATMQAVARRGWTLACVEFRTGDALQTRLARAEHPAFLGGIILNEKSEPLTNEVEKIRENFSALIGLGIACASAQEQQKAAFSLVTPLGNENKTLLYGGHPDNFTRWAVNMALDWLRRIALIMDDHGN
jgi:nicotinamide-nucleotide amidase